MEFSEIVFVFVGSMPKFLSADELDDSIADSEEVMAQIDDILAQTEDIAAHSAGLGPMGTTPNLVITILCSYNTKKQRVIQTLFNKLVKLLM